MGHAWKEVGQDVGKGGTDETVWLCCQNGARKYRVQAQEYHTGLDRALSVQSG